MKTKSAAVWFSRHEPTADQLTHISELEFDAFWKKYWEDCASSQVHDQLRALAEIAWIAAKTSRTSP